MEEEDYKCPLCFDILWYPITTPCKHVFCKSCFDTQCEEVGFKCPLCRARLSTWLRTVNKTNCKVVDLKLWKAIQLKYPTLVENRQNGDSNSVDHNSNEQRYIISAPKFYLLKNEEKNIKLHKDSENSILTNIKEWKGWSEGIDTTCRDAYRDYILLHYQTKKNEIPHRRLAKPGELRQEYEEFQQRQLQEQKESEELNFRLSKAVIQKIEEEEREEEERLKKQRELQELADEELARSMIEEESPTAPPALESLRLRWTPKRGKLKIRKNIDEADGTIISITDTSNATSGEADSSGYTDATTSSPVQNVEDIIGPWRSDSPYFMGPVPKCGESRLQKDLPNDQRMRVSHSPIPRAGVSENPSTSSKSLSSKELSNFTLVVPQPSTSKAAMEREKNLTISRCSSSNDSIGQELLHFKPIRSSPTTPPKEGSSGNVPQVVLAQKQINQHHHLSMNEVRPPPTENESTTANQTVLNGLGFTDVFETLAKEIKIEDLGDITQEDVEQSVAIEMMLQGDRELALELQKQFNAEFKQEASLERQKKIKIDYNLRKRKRENNMRDRLLKDRTQKTLDKMFLRPKKI